MPAVGSVLTKKMKKHERSFFPPFWWRKEALFVLFEPKKVVSGSLFGCFFLQRERERERVGTKNTLIKSLEERKKELLIERTKRNASDDEKEEKEEEETEDKKVPEVPLKFSSSPSLQNHHF